MDTSGGVTLMSNAVESRGHGERELKLSGLNIKAEGRS